MSEKEQKEIDILESKLHNLEKEYIQKIRKLKKHNRAAEARAYVQRRLKEEAEQTGSYVRIQSSSCKKQASKSTRALKHNDLKERRKSTSCLKCDDSEAWHQKASRLQAEELKHGNQALNVLKDEDSSSKHNTCSSDSSSNRLCDFGLPVTEKNHLNKHGHLNTELNCEKIKPERLNHQHRKSDIAFITKTFISQAKSVSNMETDSTACTKVQKQNHRIPDELKSSGENVKFAKNVNGLKKDTVQNDAAYESSEDIFLSTPKDGSSGTCEKLDPVNETENDLVIIVPGPGNLHRDKENIRNKNQLSKLKLSKYKKNFVNPVRVENMFVEGKENMITVEKTEEQVPTVNCSDKKGMSAVDKGVSELKIDKESSSQSSINTCGKSSAQGAVFSEGQVIVFERQLRLPNKDHHHGNSDTSEKISDINSNKISSENSAMQSSIESSVSTVCDNVLGEEVDENTKIRRRSGSRKRRASGLEAQRRSTRKAGHFSQESWSQSTETEGISPVFITASSAAAKKRVLISSVFQCLVDEGRRRKDFEEFNIPANVLESGFKTKAFLCHTDTGIENDCNRSINEAGCSELGTEKEMVVNEDQRSIKIESEEGSELKSELSDLPTTEIQNVNFLGKNDVISPTLFESQPSNSNIFPYCEEAVIDKVNDNTLVKIENDSMNHKNGLIKNENGQLNKVNEKDAIQNEERCKENDDSDHKNELRNKEDQPSQEEDEPSHEEDEEDCLAGSNKLVQQHLEQNINMESDADIRSFSWQLQQIGNFEIPKSDNVHSMLCVEAPYNEVIQPYVVCLCSSCLKLYTICNNQWTCVANTKLGFMTRKKSGNLIHSLPEADSVSVVLLGIKSDCTCIYIYTYTKLKWEHIVLDHVYSKSIQVCPLSSHLIVVSYYTDEKSYLCKYTQDISSGQWSNVQLESTEKQITNLIPVRGIPDAVMAFTKLNEIQIWNHMHGYLLTTVDISDVCPPEPVCDLSFAEQGFLFVPVLSKKKGKEAGTVVVINPNMNTSETLTSITMQDTWTGCSSACVMSDGILACRQNNGSIRLLDVYTGGLLATIDDVTVTCFSATYQHFVAAHKHCVHLYKLKIP